jgi:hypothetical protein
MLIFVPNFAQSFIEGLVFQLQRGSTNLPLPFPWPWNINYSSNPTSVWFRQLSISLIFIGASIFAVISLIMVFSERARERRLPLSFVAASFMMLPYIHFAYSRADIGHLSQGIFPILIGCAAILSIQPLNIKWPFTISLCIGSIWLMHIFHPGWSVYKRSDPVAIEISGDELVVGRQMARKIKLLRYLDSRYSPNGESFIVTPYSPGAYALLERKSPMWSIYALWPRDDEFQYKEIERIKNASPKFIILSERPLDGNEERRFSKSNEIIFKFIDHNYVRLKDSGDSYQRVYISK